MGDHKGGAGRKGRAVAGQATANTERNWLAWEDYDNDFLNTNYLRQTQEATVREIQSLQVYTGSGHADINDVLRRGQKLTPGTFPAPLIQDLDAMFERDSAVLKHDLIVRRRFAGKFGEDLKNLKLGDIITDQGYMSTTVNTNKMRLEIRAPAGTRAIWAQPVSNYPSENEFLLQRGTSLRVVGFNEGGETDGYPIFEVAGQR